MEFNSNQFSLENAMFRKGVLCFVALFAASLCIPILSAQATSPAVLNAPWPGSKLTASTVQFGWTAGTGVNSYMFELGSNGVGGSNLYSSGRITATLATVTNIPTNGLPLYARLYSMINNAWQYTDYIYTASGTPAPAVLNAPSPGSKLTASTVQFGWTAGTGVNSYMFELGSNGVGGSNLYSSGRITATLATVTNIPTNGLPLYARLYSMINNVWHYTDYTYTASGTPAPAVLNAPSPGSNLTASTVQFGWTAGTGVDSYMFAFGSNGVGGSNLYSSGRITATTATVTNIPINGLPLYARLYSMINNVWHYTDYTYATGSTVKGQIFLGNTCGPVASLPTFKVSIDTTRSEEHTSELQS